MMEIYRILERTIWFTPYCILIWVCYAANCLWFKFLQSLWNRKKYQPLMKTEHNPWKEHYWLNCNAPYSVFNKYSLKGQYGSNHNVPDTVLLKNVWWASEEISIRPLKGQYGSNHMVCDTISLVSFRRPKNKWALCGYLCQILERINFKTLKGQYADQLLEIKFRWKVKLSFVK